MGRFPFSQNFLFDRLKCKIMERAVQMEIFRNKRTTFEGTPLFPFQPAGTKITFPFAQKFPFCSRICSQLHQLLALSRSTDEIAGFSPAWKKPFVLTRKISRMSNRKFWLNGKRPWFIRVPEFRILLEFRNVGF